MPDKAVKIAGWAFASILGLLFTMSAWMKLTQNEAALAQASSFGFDAAVYRFIGVIEMISLILFLIPRTGILGTLLLAAYMGGAIATHLQNQEPATAAILIQSLLWITAWIRFPELKQRLTLTNTKSL